MKTRIFVLIEGKTLDINICILYVVFESYPITTEIWNPLLRHVYINPLSKPNNRNVLSRKPT